MKKVFSAIRLGRPEHWIKNLLVLAPPFFLNVILRGDVLERTACAVMSFSFLSSAIYVFNDILDFKSDRSNPMKRNRPIASGRISRRMALLEGVLLFILSAVLTYKAHNVICATVVLFLYFVANLAYSLGLKHVPVLEIFILAFGFVFRIFYGGFYFGVPISPWLFLCVFSAALCFAIGKRRGEYEQCARAAVSRPVLGQYDVRFLENHYYLCSTLTVVFYCLWTINRTDQHAIGKLGLAIPMMVFILFRYNWLIAAKKLGGDPVPLFLHDKWLVVSTACFLLVNYVVLYFGEYIPRVQY